MDTKEILCAASYYKRSYYLNEDIAPLPDKIKEELRTVTVCLAEKAKSIVTIGFYKDNGELFVQAQSDAEDLLYDDINARVEINKGEKENKEFFSSLSLWYKTFVLKKV
ncbi:MAG: hypothetical protein IJS61_01305 [Firmicutes bacterium]|nr:hypothetical protein [Bacillota bacterium]